MAEKCEKCAHADMVISSVVAANEKLEKENERLQAVATENVITAARLLQNANKTASDAKWQNDRLVAEVQRLRAAIETAPHTHFCAVHDGYPCDCWKRDALRSET